MRGLEMILMQIRKYDRIYGACLLAVTAIDALQQIHVRTRCAPGAVITLFGLDCDREGGADCFTQVAGDTTFLSVRITAQCMQPPEAW